MGAVVRTLRDARQKCVLLAPTGRAAKVLAGHAGQDASTIHRHIYRPKRNPEGGTAYGLMPNRRTDTLFIVDEASMIGESGGLPREGFNTAACWTTSWSSSIQAMGVGSCSSATTRSFRR